MVDGIKPESGIMFNEWILSTCCQLLYKDMERAAEAILFQWHGITGCLHIEQRPLRLT
jgi:hypothetical protein